MNRPLLETIDLKKHFMKKSGIPFRKPSAVRAVDGVSVRVGRGETLGLVGESGCGKTTVARMLVGLETPTSGQILFEGEEVLWEAPTPVRRRIQMVFQDPYASLDPRMTIQDIVSEPLDVQRVGTREERKQRVAQLLGQVGLDASLLRRLPRQLSGGQRQRVGVARALALSPSLIVADEPTSALDVSVRAQVINLLRDLQEEMGLSFVFISHDLSAVRHVSHNIAVMYLGKIAEQAPAEELFREPLHPYTQALISAVPVPDPELEQGRTIRLLQGDLPSPANPPSGCRFSTRCPLATARCREEEPVLRNVGEGRTVACHLV
jgi:oligopeptide/dipeptide ABC transporter ATP-binding protein